MVVQGLLVEAEMVAMTALVDWMVVKLERRVLAGGGVVTLGEMEVMGVDVEVELDRGTVMVTLLQDLQHMRR